jgi:hypothetical protein
MAEPQMTEFQRSVQLWSVLAYAAKMQQVLSYETLAKLTGMAPIGQARPLGNIWFYCKQNDLPSLTSIVVNQRTGNPPDDIGGEDLSTTQRRVFIFDWLSHHIPSVQDFENARIKEEAKAQKAAG